MDNEPYPPSSHKPHPKRKLHMGSRLCCFTLRCWVTYFLFSIIMSISFFVVPFIVDSSNEFRTFCYKIGYAFLYPCLFTVATVYSKFAISRTFLSRSQQRPKPKPRRRR
ncbi:hypothetical protein NPIL_517541 [Nephila pilipes]|uniref:Uncharacterized protein n=1 Tax=Nephila pilipes TaxID=299642 RepID=A0A8X6R0U9_NEPPI|nr:hypothetical protein NPIL_517541 [Nephila pilipes]